MGAEGASQPAGAAEGMGLRWIPSAWALAVIGGFSAVAAITQPFTWSARIAVALAICSLLVLAVRRGWHRRGLPAADATPVGPRAALNTTAVVVWVVILGAVIAVQLLNYTAEPREVYPTLSSLVEDLLTSYPGRAAGFAVWLWAGWYLVQR